MADLELKAMNDLTKALEQIDDEDVLTRILGWACSRFSNPGFSYQNEPHRKETGIEGEFLSEKLRGLKLDNDMKAAQLRIVGQSAIPGQS